jgi:desulfoferrodoxin (superoxide reductase-like protein)
MKLRILIFLISLFSSYVGFVSAHPPKKIEIEIDYSKKLIEVTVIHTVKDSITHYIDMINIELNEQNIIKQVFLSQMTKEKQKVIYLINDFETEDKITIIANCNRYGKKKRTIFFEL